MKSSALFGNDRFNRRVAAASVLTTLLTMFVFAQRAEAVPRAALVRDLTPGTEGSSPMGFVAFDGNVYFSASDSVHGTELWKSDGTEAGTGLVKDINPGTESSFPRELTVSGGTLFFNAQDSVHGIELWKTDGTESGTVLLEVETGVAHSNPAELTDLGGTLFFSAISSPDTFPGPPEHGRELWKSDGTEAGTVMVKDINPGRANSFPGSITAIGGTLYFSAFRTSEGQGLWKSDGTEAGTELVKVMGGSAPGSFTEAGRQIFFVASDGVHGEELWKTDGTEAGTILVRDINPGSSDSRPTELVDLGGTLFFFTSRGGSDLWKSDGTEAGTVLVKDLPPVLFQQEEPHDLVVSGGRLFFGADDKLWTSDGTEAGTVVLHIVHCEAFGCSGVSGPEDFTDVGGTLYFAASRGDIGRELFRSDGTQSGTVAVQNINPGPGGSNPEALANIGGTVFFSASLPESGRELWTTTDTPNGLPSAAGLAQFEEGGVSGGRREIATGGIAVGTTIFGSSMLFSGEVVDPDGDSVLAQVEVKPVGTPFDETGILTSRLAANGSTLETRIQISPGSYHWRARGMDELGDAGPWAPFGGNAESEVDFRVDAIPGYPGNLAQLDSGGAMTIPTGDATTDSSPVFAATLTDPDPGDGLRLEVEVDPIGTHFDGTGVVSSALVSNGSVATVGVSSLPLGGYHWQARVIDEHGGPGPWLEFGDPDPFGSVLTDLLVAMPVDTDIKPGAPNRIAVRSRAPIHIAIFSTSEFDATTVDPANTCFGDADAPAERACSQTGSSPQIRDVDRDGDSDLVLAYATDKTGIDPGDSRACLVGYTFADVPVADCEAVETA